MIKITICPHAHIINLFTDPSDTKSDYWLGRKLPASAVTRLERYEELASARILDAIEDAMVFWSSEKVHLSGVVREFKLDPEDEDVRPQIEHILGQTLIEVVEWSPSEETTA